ncbi:glycolipid transfer protein GLTP [Nitzschia inconspicua]|uniref:Glycolipid transfer protein GLTP n=1 Tax=Nitzschia inconspicua TaxID=303405 RepID=A0A9K3L7U1_9STRA|nr:glycolipid transfer protein GLTP [Nitzschia inconspicua]
MKRSSIRFFQSKTTAKDSSSGGGGFFPTAPELPSSSWFFAKHGRAEMLLRKSQHTHSILLESEDSIEPGNTFSDPTTTSGGTLHRHKTTTLAALPTTTTSNYEFEFETCDTSVLLLSSSSSSSSLRNQKDSVINSTMMKELYSCDDDLYHDQQQSATNLSPHLPSHSLLGEKKTSSSAQNTHPQEQQQQQSPQPLRWSVGKISIFILAFLSLTDIVLYMVEAQMESLEAPDHYDALSADVIRPAFRYHRHYTNSDQRRSTRPSMGLGSAAISSVTTALSPILPFTGGIDLRREDYWTNGWWGSVSSVMEQVRDAFEGAPSTTETTASTDAVHTVLKSPRGGATVTQTKKRKKAAVGTSSKANFVFSSTEPFVPLNEIADLTLQDVAESFRFAVENTRHDFQLSNFMSRLLPRAKKMVDRMATAIATARGKGVMAPVTGEDRASLTSGDIDALSFCAAMRVFAEWRVLRQVPPGYKGYAVGMTLGQKDIVQNIAKIEQAIHSLVEHRLAVDDHDNNKEPVISPTLRELLQYEVDAGVQDVAKLPRLKEKSAGMGLLWVRRQLQYQTAIFVNAMETERFGSTRAAVQSAYDEVYNRYHGWAVQKIFSYSFQAAPDASEIYKYMDLHKLNEVQKEAFDHFLGQKGNQRNASHGNESSNNPLERFGRHIGKEWDKFAGNVVQEWDNLAMGVGQLFGHRPKPVLVLMVTTNASPQSTTTAMDMESPVSSPEADQGVAHMHSGPSSELAVESFINREMEKNAYAHIRSYLQVATPLLKDLENLFDEFNMNDPTKV